LTKLTKTVFSAHGHRYGNFYTDCCGTVSLQISRKINNKTKMNSNYKIGDRVVCIDDRDSSNLMKNYEYKIVDVNQHGNIRVTEGTEWEPFPHYYKPLRFDVIATDQKTKKNTVKKETKSFDSSKKYQTKEREQWRFIGMGSDEEYPVVGEYFSKVAEAWLIESWTLDGEICVGLDSERDISVIPEEVEVVFGGINITVYDDNSVLIDSIATDRATTEEIENLIAALSTFKQII
jgi:hypothetical protein